MIDSVSEPLMERAEPKGFRNRAAAPLRASGILSRLAAAELAGRGVDLRPLLDGAGIAPEFLADPDCRLLVSEQAAFLDAAAEKLKDPLLTFRIARNYDVRRTGILYYILASAGTFGAGLEQVTRYLPIENESIRQEVEADGRGATIAWSYGGEARSAERHISQFLAVVLVRLARHLCGVDVAPEAVSFAHGANGDRGEIEAFFRCPIAFDAGRTEVVLPGGTVELPVTRADPHLNDLLTRLAERALAERAESSPPLRSEVERLLAFQLPKGVPSPAELAKSLGMSRRTFERRLAAEGTNVSGIIDDIRRELALQYLREPRHSVTEIAWMLGFADVSGFTHFFRRMTRQTPTAYRASVRKA